MIGQANGVTRLTISGFFIVLVGVASVSGGENDRTFGPNVYYVNAVVGDNNNAGLSSRTPFATIQKGIDTASDGDRILVYPGIYQEEIDFSGKAIVVRGVVEGAAGVPVLQNPRDFAVSFYSGETRDSVLRNIVIRNSFMGVFISGSSPTLTNLTIVDNRYGIEVYSGSEPDISNIIFWNNAGGDLFGSRVRYSCITHGHDGEGNINGNPLLVDLGGGDYHLYSERGRYWWEHDVWILDPVSSPCIDAGDPNADPANEPLPNGGRINMGAYGGTVQASLSPSEQPYLLSKKAANPYPADGADYIEGHVISWTAGLNAVLHDVYFSSNEDAVANGDISNKTGTYRGRQAPPSYTPPEGIWSWHYPSAYWRIDEVDSEGNITKGDVWTFRTVGPPSPGPPKGRTCFTSETGVWVDGTYIFISSVCPGGCVGGINGTTARNTLPYLGRVRELQVHEGIFECYDIILESGNGIAVAENHYFLTESGQWVTLQNLRVGMKLQTPRGSIGIIGLTKKPLPYMGKVYNLKIEGSDRYLVGKDAVIVRDH